MRGCANSCAILRIGMPARSSNIQVRPMTRAEPTSSDITFAWGEFRLSVLQRVLSASDRPVRVGSRALDILFALLERPGEVVSKNELMARVWPGVYVEEGTLRVHIAALRKILGHNHSGMRYVENVLGRGYRFVAPVTVIDRVQATFADTSPTSRCCHE